MSPSSPSPDRTGPLSARRARELREHADAVECLFDIELAEAVRWRERAEGLLSGGVHLEGVIAALCADALTVRGVRPRVEAVSAAAELLAEVGLLRGPLLDAVRATLGWLLDVPPAALDDVDAWYVEICARLVELGVPLPALLPAAPDALDFRA